MDDSTEFDSGEADVKLIEMPAGLGQFDTKKKITRRTNFFIADIVSIYSDMEQGGKESGYLMDVTLCEGKRKLTM